MCSPPCAAASSWRGTPPKSPPPRLRPLPLRPSLHVLVLTPSLLELERPQQRFRFYCPFIVFFNHPQFPHVVFCSRDFIGNARPLFSPWLSVRILASSSLNPMWFFCLLIFFLGLCFYVGVFWGLPYLCEPPQKNILVGFKVPLPSFDFFFPFGFLRYICSIAVSFWPPFLPPFQLAHRNHTRPCLCFNPPRGCSRSPLLFRVFL